MKQGLSGYVPIRNGFKLDYCFQEAVQSLLPVCDEVIISVGLTDNEKANGDDGTLLAALALANSNGKIRVVEDRWAEAVGDPTMLKRWLNRIRAECRFTSQITLDADEVLDPGSYGRVRQIVGSGESLWFYRINLWRDPWHEAPWGTVCGEFVARAGPTSYEMVSDGPENPEVPIRTQGRREDSLVIWHLGFLRRPQAFFDKSKVMQWHLHNCYDPRLRRAEEENRDWVKDCPFVDAGSGKEIPLRTHGKLLPESIKPWLRERGHQL